MIRLGAERCCKRMWLIMLGVTSTCNYWCGKTLGGRCQRNMTEKGRGNSMVEHSSAHVMRGPKPITYTEKVGILFVSSKVDGWLCKLILGC